MGDDLEIASRLRNLASAWGNLPLLIKAAERLEKLAGPPEPSEEEVARVIGPLRLCSCESCLEHTTETARAVLALFRSRING